ncbi:hypothetical protein [Ornithobacterium rhinotracheale]|uniref:hypothetical protein n=1 Tax=Ornithobacterium rhinotracheale TaxID=28251 RepID=UPI004035F180
MPIIELAITTLCSVFSAYRGEYETNSSPEMREIKREVKDIRIPTPKDDRGNLRGDCNSVISDYSSSLKKAKLNGKATEKTSAY